jgi:hypothetical protein
MIKRLAEAIGYPDAVPDNAESFLFRVDGAEIWAEKIDGKLILSLKFNVENGVLRTLAEYAAGRMAKEDATLAAEPGKAGAFLWREIPQGADARAQVRMFEEFLDSCDWWRERVDALGAGSPSMGAAEGAPQMETMVIRP